MSQTGNLGFEIGMCVICSRGLIHSRTMESVDRNLALAARTRKQTWEIIISHERPIPDAQNWVIDLARAANPTWIWMVEEDIKVPDGRLLDMIDALKKKKVKVVASTYKLKGGISAHQVVRNQGIVFTGLGCALFDPSVFDRLTYPWFQLEQYSINPDLIKKLSERAKYGGHDVNFFMRLREEKIPWYLYPDKVNHLIVKSHGRPGDNHGYHDIDII